MGGLTGAGVRVNVQWESSYLSAESSPSPFVPGANAILEDATLTQNNERIWIPGQLTAEDLKAAGFDGAYELSFDLVDPWMFRSVYGAPSTNDNGDGTYTHTYSLGSPDSFQLLEGYETSTTAERTMKGCVAASFEVNPQAGQAGTVPCRVRGFYGKESHSTGVSLTPQDKFDEDVLGPEDADLKLGGSSKSIVLSASLSYSWQLAEPVPTFGSRFPTDFVASALEPDVEWTKLKQNASELNDAYGGSTSMQEDLSTSKFELDLDNGASAGSGKNRILFEGSGDSQPESYNDTPAGDPTQRIEETLNRLIENLDVKATNETSSPP